MEFEGAELEETTDDARKREPPACGSGMRTSYFAASRSSAFALSAMSSAVLPILMRAAASRIDCHVNVSAIADPRPQESYRPQCASGLVSPVEESDNPRIEIPTLALVQVCNVPGSTKNGSRLTSIAQIKIV
jgi:hypothetical protein